MRSVFRSVSVALAVAMVASVMLATPSGAQIPNLPEPEVDISYEVLAEGSSEPLWLEITPDGRIIWGERDGTLSVLTPQGLRIVAAELRPAGNLCASCTPEPDYLSHPPTRLGVGGLEEGGLYGILLDNDFAENNKIYIYRSVAGTRREVSPGVFWGDWHLSTFVLDPLTNLLDLSSEEVILEVPAEWDNCCHYGGDLNYLPDGTIILTTGDDVNASSSGGYGPRDHRSVWLNGELTSGNPADRRGKILRLREDGSVPDGSVPGEMPNPFIGMEGWNPYIDDSPAEPYVADRAGIPNDGWIEFDPYVYSLGYKQPWRTVVHPQTGTMYVSEVGPDAGSDDPARGPRGFEEINKVPFGGGTHAGWPRCAGPNWSYMDVNWETGDVGGPLDCSADAPIARPIGGTEPTIRGMTGATLYYPSGACDGTQNETTTYDCDQWPIVGSGGKTSEPVVFYSADITGDLRLPERYNNRMLMLEWSRNFILSIGYDPDTAELNLDNDDMWQVKPPLYSINPGSDRPQGTVSVQQTRFMAPVDAKVGPDGALYFLEYGAFFYCCGNGRLSRIKCAGCLPKDRSRNYGLPTGPVTPSKPLTAGVASGLPSVVFTAIAAIGLVAFGRRRRRLIL